MEGETSKTYVFGNDGSGMNSPWPWMFAGNNGFGNGFGGLGGGILGFLLGLFFGNGQFGNGFFGNGGNGNAAAGFLSSQMNGDSGREMLMNAINGTDDDVRALASSLNADFNEVRSAVSAIQLGIQNVGSQVGMSGLQIQNAILSGDASIISKLSECCCENRLLTTQQGYEAQLRTLEQTNQLSAQAERNTNSIIGAINAQTVAMNDGFCSIKERELQSKIDALTAANTALRGQIDNAAQTSQILSSVSALFGPLQKEVNDIAAKQPNTIPVTWPNVQAVSTTPYIGNFYGGFNPYGYGFSGNSYWG